MLCIPARSVYRIQTIVILVLMLVGCGTPGASDMPVVVALPTTVATPLPRATLAPRATLDPARTPLLTAYRAHIAAVLASDIPIMPLDGKLTLEQARAQAVAIHDTRVQQYIRDPQTHQARRIQVFGVYPLRESDRTDATASACQPLTSCYRVEIYHFALDAATSAVVNAQTQAVVQMQDAPHTQPDIPEALTKIAIEIARASPDVARGLGMSLRDMQPVMANTKTALNATQCERSSHLCVAPTFPIWDQALWAIVDLTDGDLVGTRWTQIGSTGNAVTEKALQDTVVTGGYCDHTTHIEQYGWTLDYILTSSDGLRISDVRYHGTPIFDSVKLVDWHVSYSRQDGFGYSDAVGCPMFSQAAVIAFQPPRVEDLRNGAGFTLSQTFSSEQWPRPCNYNYQQQYQFFTDGRFRPATASLGRGCGNDGT